MEKKKSKKDIVTYEQQREMGLIRQNKQFVPPAKSEVRITRLPSVNDNFVLDVTPSSQQVVKMETSYVDKAKGFHIVFSPIAILAGGVVLVLAVYYKNVELWSLLALIIFALATLAAWLIAWLFTVLLSPEMVSFYEAWRKWNIVDREQKERHKYYKKGGS